MLSEALERLLPHAGRMRLIERVLRWDAQSIECAVHDPCDPAHPLRLDDELPAVIGLEYGAQAMAVHGALVAGRDAKPRVGLLVAAHEVNWIVPRLDAEEFAARELTVRASRLLGSANQVVYEFVLAAGERSLVSGRASVILSVEQ